MLTEGKSLGMKLGLYHQQPVNEGAPHIDIIVICLPSDIGFVLYTLWERVWLLFVYTIITSRHFHGTDISTWDRQQHMEMFKFFSF